jgi:hypothetical protein
MLRAVLVGMQREANLSLPRGQPGVQVGRGAGDPAFPRGITLGAKPTSLPLRAPLSPYSPGDSTR